jgi:hypothetical protein
VFLLAGFTALAILAIAAFAVLAPGGEDAENFTPNDRGLLPVGSLMPLASPPRWSGVGTFL